MQMIATAKFQKSLKRAVGTKPYTLKVRELVRELAASVGERRASAAAPADAMKERTNRIALLVITSNRGLAGAYNGSVLRAASAFIRAAGGGRENDRPLRRRQEGHQLFQYPEAADHASGWKSRTTPKFAEVERAGQSASWTSSSAARSTRCTSRT